MAESSIRVLLSNLPAASSDIIISEFQRHHDINVMGVSNGGDIELLMDVSRGVDVVILGTQALHPPPGICSHLLNEFPDLKILVYALGQDRALGYWLGARRCQINDVSAEGLLDGVRRLFEMVVTL